MFASSLRLPNPDFMIALHLYASLTLHKPNLLLNKAVVLGVELFFKRIFQFRNIDVFDGAYDVPKVSLDLLPFLFCIQI